MGHKYSFHNFSSEIASGHWTGWAQASRSLFQGPAREALISNNIHMPTDRDKPWKEPTKNRHLPMYRKVSVHWDPPWCGMRPSPLTIIKLNTLTSAISARVTGSRFTRSPQSPVQLSPSLGDYQGRYVTSINRRITNMYKGSKKAVSQGLEKWHKVSRQEDKRVELSFLFYVLCWNFIDL